MKHPNPRDLARDILAIGTGALLYMVDLSRTYRQLRTCPLDWPFLTVRWEGVTLVDVGVPFGLGHSTSVCQRMTVAMEEVVMAGGRGRSTPIRGRHGQHRLHRRRQTVNLTAC